MPSDARLALLFRACLGALIVLAAPASRCPADDAVTVEAAARVGLRPYWSIQLPTDTGLFERMVLLDDNLYALTSQNNVVTVHADTGVVRWSHQVSKPGNRVLGPTHADRYALFTSQMGVELFHRQTGRPFIDERLVRGVIIESDGDTATINIGRVHGLSLGTRLTAYRRSRGDRLGRRLGEFEATVVRERESRGLLTLDGPTDQPDSGDLVEGEFGVPRALVSLPHAPSSPAVGDARDIYYGAANRRVYKLRIIDGIRQWEIATSGPLSALPRYAGDQLIFAAQDGRVTSATLKDRRVNWSFETEGAIFGEPWVDASGVYVSSSDRSVYALDAADGHKRWRRQFGSTELTAPIVAGDTLFVLAPGEGFYALNTKDGAIRWRLDGSARLLTADQDTAFVLRDLAEPNLHSGGRSIDAIELAGGRVTATLKLALAEFVLASATRLTIIVGDTFGHVQCLRSTKYPHLKPEQLAAVLFDDAQAARPPRERRAAAASQPAEAGGGAADAAADPFSSRGKARPVGGHGVVPLPEDAEKPAEEGAAASKASGEEGEDAPKDEPADEAAEESESEASEDAEADSEEPAAEDADTESEDADSNAADADTSDDGDASTNGG